jgi:hypothetical protein
VPSVSATTFATTAPTVAPATAPAPMNPNSRLACPTSNAAPSNIQISSAMIAPKVPVQTNSPYKTAGVGSPTTPKKNVAAAAATPIATLAVLARRRPASSRVTATPSAAIARYIQGSVVAGSFSKKSASRAVSRSVCAAVDAESAATASPTLARSVGRRSIPSTTFSPARRSGEWDPA